MKKDIERQPEPRNLPCIIPEGVEPAPSLEQRIEERIKNVLKHIKDRD